MVKNLPAMPETQVLEMGASPGEGNGYPLQLPGESHGERSLMDYSPWGYKESDMTQQLTLLLLLTCYKH